MTDPPGTLAAALEPLDPCPRPRPGIETAFLPPEVVLLDDETGAVYQLNSSAAAVWLLIDGERSVSGIVEELRALVPGAAEQIRPDVAATIADFQTRGLLDGAPAHGELLVTGTGDVPMTAPPLVVLRPPPDP